MKPFRRLLVANRSEIAIRVFRAATELGLRTVAVFAQEDRFSMHRFKADEAYELDPSKGPVGAYLDIPTIVALAREKRVDAIHPGYGFLSENASLARACAEAGVAFVGPRPELLDLLGDKVASRHSAEQLGLRTLPGTAEPVSNREAALEAATRIGFPLIIKAAFGGGGRGMRVVDGGKDLSRLLDEAQQEAQRAFGNPAVFLERFVPRAKHIEVQILGDQHGAVMHLHERDCSIQRRHQKVVEVAPSVGLDPGIREALTQGAVRLAQALGYDNAGTVEFLVDADSGEWFFIEMNPRIQVEHTVTEEITGIDLVRSQILIAQGFRLDSPQLDLPPQEAVPRIGWAVQCRVTTEDPENGFTPDIGKILTYRSASGLGIRLDGGMGTAGSLITPFYDSLLVKVTARGRTFESALNRMDRALREFRIRGVKTNIPFLENVIANEVFRKGEATTRLIDTTPELFRFRKRRDRATKILHYLGNVIVNGNPYAKGYRPPRPIPEAPAPAYDHRAGPPDGSRQLLQKLGPEGFCRWILEQKRLLLTDTTFRDAHQSLLATRVRTYDMLRTAGAVARRAPGLFSLEMWGGATFDSAMRFLGEDPWERLRKLREAIPNVCFQMLFRGSNAVGYSNYPDNVVAGFVRHAAECGMDIFRIFDSLNYTPNLRAAMEAVRETGAVCEGTICYTGNILDPSRDKYSLRYYVDLAKELVRMGAHIVCIKDMAGLCRPYAAHLLVKTLKEETGVPIHFHTHDSSGVNSASVLQASDAGVDIADAALAALSGSTSQPNLNSIVAALQFTERDTGLDLEALNELSSYWEEVRACYRPFDTSPPFGSAEVYLHEMPGGQFTNLKEQAASMDLGHRWRDIARCYAEVNRLFGDIVKVTPSSKVVGDMTMFLITRGIEPADVPNLPPGTPFPESVIEMLAGDLGQPLGGWPPDLQRVVLGGRPGLTERPGALAPLLDLDQARESLAPSLGRPATDDDLYSHLMYPQVFKDFHRFRTAYSDLSVLPSPAFFYGLAIDEEIAVPIQEGKILFISLLHVSEPNEEGNRTLVFELNGVPRHSMIPDHSVAPAHPQRPKADPADANHIGAPMPGMISSVAVSVGHKVKEGDKLLTLEAMKMLTSLSSPRDGIVDAIHVRVGESVESKDLLLTLAPAPA